MFALICAGRLVQTECEQVSGNQVAFPIANPDLVDHVAVFLTGAQPLPEGSAAACYFCLPASGVTSYLGHLTNEKPSAIFRFAKLKGSAGTASFPGLNGSSQGFAGQTAVLGVAVEPAQSVLALEPDPGVKAAAAGEQFHEFSRKMAESLFNHLGSYAGPPHNFPPGESVVPMRAVEQWYSRFTEKLTNNVYFWRS